MSGGLTHCDVPLQLEQFRWRPCVHNISRGGEWTYSCPACGMVGWREEFDPASQRIDNLLFLPMWEPTENGRGSPPTGEVYWRRRLP